MRRDVRALARNHPEGWKLQGHVSPTTTNYITYRIGLDGGGGGTPVSELSRQASAFSCVRRSWHLPPPLSQSVTSEILAALSEDSRRVELAGLDDRHSND